jgi:hypothetical protein
MGLRLAVGSAAALLLLCVVAPAAFTYPGQIAQQVAVAGPAGVLSCNTNLTVKATVLDAAGTPVDNQTVVWTFGVGKLAGDTIVTPTTTTNASGVATATVKLACVVGNRTIVAADAPSAGQVVLGITAVGLPPTGTVEPTTPLWAYGLAALGVLLAAFIVGRRVLQGR